MRKEDKKQRSAVFQSLYKKQQVKINTKQTFFREDKKEAQFFVPGFKVCVNPMPNWEALLIFARTTVSLSTSYLAATPKRVACSPVVQFKFAANSNSLLTR